MTTVRDIIRGPAKRLLAALRWQKAALVHSAQPVPLFAQALEGVPPGLKVHLGAGEINLQGWVNIDARPFSHIHSTSLALAEFTDGAIAAIYICHVLEHLSFADAAALLRALHTKLMPGGVIIVAVPDFDAIVRVYAGSGSDLDSVRYALMGGQGYEYNFHRSVYNRDALARLLTECGYGPASAWDTKGLFGQELGDFSSMTMTTKAGETVEMSLNLRAAKTA